MSFFKSDHWGKKRFFTNCINIALRGGICAIFIPQVSSADGSCPSVNEDLYTAVRRVLLCLDNLTDLLLTPGGSGEGDPQLLWLLQQEVTDNNTWINIYLYINNLLYLKEQLQVDG